MLSLADMLTLATSKSSVELYHKGKYRGKLCVTQCQVEEPMDMLDKDGKQGYVSTYPPRKQLNTSASLPAYWPDSSTYPHKPNQLYHPSYPNHPPNPTFPPNYQASYQPLAAVSNPVGMSRRKPSLHDQVLRKVSQGVSKIGLGSLGENLEKFGQNNSLGSFGSLVNRATRTKN